MVLKNKRPAIIASIGAGMLLIPFIAMQFTTEVNWDLMDFIVAGVLLFGFGTLLEVSLRIIRKRKPRIIAGIVILLTLILLWVEMAVGLFGSPIAGT